MQFDHHSVFEYRGLKHRVVLEMPEKDRTTESSIAAYHAEVVRSRVGAITTSSVQTNL